MNQLIPDELDWVTERAKCSAGTVLKQLESQVKADVERRNSLLTPSEVGQRISFEFGSGSQSSFYVCAWRHFERDPSPERLGLVTFEKLPGGIKIIPWIGKEETEPIVGMLTLGNDGKCRLRVKDLDEYKLWQFRKLALEPVLFTATNRFQE
jgi:hypothetical protein